MDELNGLLEIALCICLIALVRMKVDVRAVIMAATFYLAAVIREGER